MPQSQLTLLEGRTAEQKRKVVARITDVLVEDAGASREAITITFVEVSKESYASGGVLIADKTQPNWRMFWFVTADTWWRNGPPRRL